MTITEFLLARIAEDEEVARDALDADIQTVAHEHMVRWQPSRVLAECEAKRRIVAEHGPTSRFNRHSWGCGCGCNEKPEVGCSCGRRSCTTVAILAAVYADHPDYRDEWRV